jgi:hypothetical protein
MLAVALITSGLGAAEPPYVGKWKLNPAKSTLTGDTVTIEAISDGMMEFRSQGFIYRFKIDGKEYPTPIGGTAAWTAAGTNGWEIANRVQGKVISTVRITVTGDVDPAAVRGIVERTLAAWPAGGARPTVAYPSPPPPKSTTIYLVDKPKAAQSVFEIGLPGPPRDTPDYYALQVMNNILGGLFQSRLNHDIREVKGYSYGVGSGFAFGRGPGAFEASGGIITAKTDSALIAFMTHLRGVQGGVPFTEDEIRQGKESLIQSLPRRFASVNATGGAVGSVYVQDLGESYWQDYAKKIDAVTTDDLVRVAKKYIDLDKINILIVGDRAVIEEPLRKTGIAPIVILDAEGKPVTSS